MIENILIKIKKFLKKEKKDKDVKILILGLAFKGSPETSDIRGSSSIDLLKKFKKEKV